MCDLYDGELKELMEALKAFTMKMFIADSGPFEQTCARTESK